MTWTDGIVADPEHYRRLCGYFFRRLRIEITIPATPAMASSSTTPGSGIVAAPAYAVVDATMRKKIRIKGDVFIDNSLGGFPCFIEELSEGYNKSLQA